MVKELGKIPRNFGRRGTILVTVPRVRELVVVAIARGTRLFIKNTGAC